MSLHKQLVRADNELSSIYRSQCPCSHLLQIVQNLKQGHTGQLSLITFLLNVAGSGARVFTIMQARQPIEYSGSRCISRWSLLWNLELEKPYAQSLRWIS